MQRIREPKKMNSQNSKGKQSSDLPWIFNLAYGIFALMYLPTFLVKIRQEKNPARLLRERLGLLPGTVDFSNSKVIWLHAVSVGEVMAVRRFVGEFLKAFPDYRLVLTTVT